MNKTSDNLCTGGGLAAILLWSTTFAIARSLSEQVGPLTAGAAVYLIGGCACLLRLRLSGRTLTRFLKLPRLYLFGCGSAFVFHTTVIYLAVGMATDRGQVLEIALVNYLWPTLTILLSLALLRKHGSLWLLPGTALALTGVFLVMTQEGHVDWMSWLEHLRKNPAAYLLALSAAISWALYSNLARRWAAPGGGGAVELFLIAAGLVLLGMRLLVTEPNGWGWRSAGEVLGLAAATALAYMLWDVAMRKGNLLLVAAMSYFAPLFSTMLSCVYLKVSPGPKLWFGCILLVCGSLLTWRSVSDGPARAGG